MNMRSVLRACAFSFILFGGLTPLLAAASSAFFASGPYSATLSINVSSSLPGGMSFTFSNLAAKPSPNNKNKVALITFDASTRQALPQPNPHAISGIIYDVKNKVLIFPAGASDADKLVYTQNKALIDGVMAAFVQKKYIH